VLVALFGEPGTPQEIGRRRAAANQFKRGAQLSGITLAAQAERIRLAHERYPQHFRGAALTPHALVNHLSELTHAGYRERPPELRREVVQRVTHYASRRVERSIWDVADATEREAGG
jgi:hypothetical protein